MRGDTLSATDAEALGASRSLLDQTVRVMTQWGFKFARTAGDDGRTFLRLTNPDHVPRVRNERLPLAAVKKTPAKAAKKAAPPVKKAAPPMKPKAPAPKAAAPVLPKRAQVLPATGTTLTVYVQQVDEDGGVILGLKGDTGAWVARVEGYGEVALTPTS